MIIEMPLQKVSQPIGFYRDHTQYIHTSSGAYVIFQLSKKHQVLTEFYWLKNVIPTLQIALTGSCYMNYIVQSLVLWN